MSVLHTVKVTKSTVLHPRPRTQYHGQGKSLSGYEGNDHDPAENVESIATTGLPAKVCLKVPSDSPWIQFVT